MADQAVASSKSGGVIRQTSYGRQYRDALGLRKGELRGGGGSRGGNQLKLTKEQQLAQDRAEISRQASQRAQAERIKAQQEQIKANIEKSVKSDVQSTQQAAAGSSTLLYTPSTYTVAKPTYAYAPASRGTQKDRYDYARTLSDQDLIDLSKSAGLNKFQNESEAAYRFRATNYGRTIVYKNDVQDIKNYFRDKKQAEKIESAQEQIQQTPNKSLIDTYRNFYRKPAQGAEKVFTRIGQDIRKGGEFTKKGANKLIDRFSPYKKNETEVFKTSIDLGIGFVEGNLEFPFQVGRVASRYADPERRAQIKELSKERKIEVFNETYTDPTFNKFIKRDITLGPSDNPYLQVKKTPEGVSVVSKLSPKDIENLDVTSVVVPIVVGGTIVGFRKAKIFLNEPVVVPEAVKVPVYRSKTAVLNKFQGDEALSNEASFILTGQKAERKAFVTTRGEVLKNKIIGAPLPGGAKNINELKKLVKVGDLSVQDAAKGFVKGEVITYEPPSASVSVLPLSKVKEGGRVESLIYSQQGRATKLGDTTISKFETISRGEQTPIEKIDITKLDPITKRTLGEIYKEGFAIKKGQTVQLGDVLTTDLRDLPGPSGNIQSRFKDLVNEKGFLNDITDQEAYKVLDIKAPGKRTSGGSLTIIQEPSLSLEFENEYGLRAYERYLEKIGAIDRTLPGKGNPRNVIKIEGEVDVYEINLPGKSETPEVLRPNPNRPRTSSISQEQKQVQDQLIQDIQAKIGAAAIRQSKGLKTRPSLKSSEIVKSSTAQVEREYPLIVGGAGTTKVRSIYSGLSTNDLDYQSVNSNARNIYRDYLGLANNNLSKELSKTINKELSKEVAKEINKETQKEIQKEQQKELLKFQEKFVEKQGSRYQSRGIDNSALYDSSFPFVPNKKRKSYGNRKKAYSVLIKKGGRYTYVATGIPRGLARKVLSDKLLTDLARSGRVVESGYTDIADINFNPNPKQFRNYKVRRGKKVLLGVDEFIQRQSALLQTPEEKLAIKRSRRR